MSDNKAPASDADIHKKFQGPKVFSIALAHLLHDIFSIFLTPLLPFLREKHNLSYTQVSYMSASGRLASVLSPVLGLISERIGLKWVVIITPAITSIAMSFLGIAPNYPTLLFLLMLMGLSSAFFHVPSPVLMRNVAGEKVGLAMSLYMMSGQAARAIGPFVAVGALRLFGLEGTWILSFLGIGNSILLFFMLHRMDFHLSQKKKGSHESVKEVFKKYRFLFGCIALIIFGQSLMKTAISSFMPLYLTNLGIEKGLAGEATALIQIAGVMGSFCCGVLTDKISSQRVLMTTGLLGPIFLLLLCQLSASWLLIPILFLLGFTILSSNAVFMSMINRIRSHQSAFLNGMYMTLNFGVGIFAIILIGWLGDKVELKVTYYFAAVVAFLTLPVIRLIPKQAKSI